MKYKQLVDHYGGPSKAAQALGLDRQNVHVWKKRKRIPSRWQLKAAALSKGRLKADDAAQAEAATIAAYMNGNGK